MERSILINLIGLSVVPGSFIGVIPNPLCMNFTSSLIEFLFGNKHLACLHHYLNPFDFVDFPTRFSAGKRVDWTTFVPARSSYPELYNSGPGVGLCVIRCEAHEEII